MKAQRSIVVGFALGMAVAAATGQTKLFSELVGPVPVDSVKAGGALQVPFIIWGGDMATFYANGGLKTKPGTLFHKQGLNLNLTPGDDFIQQVRDYRPTSRLFFAEPSE